MRITLDQAVLISQRDRTARPVPSGAQPGGDGKTRQARPTASRQLVGKQE